MYRKVATEMSRDRIGQTETARPKSPVPLGWAEQRHQKWVGIFALRSVARIQDTMGHEH